MIHSPGPFKSFIHADAGPQNFLLIGDGVIALDYEFGTFGFGPLDVVSARLGFPHSQQAMTVPRAIVEAGEAAYRAELASAVDEASDDEAFAAALTDAAAHWALVRWVGLWRRVFARRNSESSGSSTDEAVATSRSQAYTVYRAFVDLARATGSRPALARTVDAYAEALCERFPALDRTEVYPALLSPPRCT